MTESESPVGEHPHQLKIVVVGDGASGKSSIVTCFSQVQFEKDYEQTIGVDFFSRRIQFSGGRSALLQIWDIGGQTLGGNMLDKYISGSDIVMFVYDITNSKSFEDLSDWHTTVTECVNPSCSFILVANKADLEHLRVVTRQQDEEFAKEHDMTSYLVSAKSVDSVNSLFKRVVSKKLNFRISKDETDMNSIEVAAPSKPVPNTNPDEPAKPSASKKKLKSKICSIL